MSYEKTSDREVDENPAQKTSETEHRDQSTGERTAGVAPAQSESNEEQATPAGVADPKPDREPVSIAELLPSEADQASLVTVSGDALPDVAHAALDAGGEAPSNDVKAAVEEQLGQPVADVRLHAGQKATKATEALGVHAFVLDTDVVVNQHIRDSLGREETHLLAQHLVNTTGGSGAPAVLAEGGAAAENATGDE